MRSREALANWLICVVLNSDRQSDRFSFTSDPTGGDGIIYDSKADSAWKTEHVMVPEIASKTTQNDTEARAIEAINKKNDKGAAYAGGKQLLVFLNSSGQPWYPNKLARQLPQPLHFDEVWVLGLQHVQDDAYNYGVSQLTIDTDCAAVWTVHIARSFDAWEVQRIQ